ncbi:MAG: class I SAM-dependent methyltransferase [Altibacter sp.]|uniref:class I SAM-dependent methyltransferase n=1 Tax=Altibacter sp. TaxID=2024823 RepID=UPI001D5CA9B0|nr:class I SAM-dependent methyltransferase [Altibacter sp.]MBZ0325981.1 class I SAM-dependent methyltransferase [Altibacter sp.]
MVPCIMCHSDRTQPLGVFQEVPYFRCRNCHTVYKDPVQFLDPETEKQRYLLHKNDVDDIHYQQFVKPIFDAVVQKYNSNCLGLDFGAGSGPVITKLLRDRGYSMSLYDPFFYPDTAVLEPTYDFIVCCEVIEHFHNPSKEFQLLFDLLKPQGRLFCMSELLPEQENFEAWYYKNDPTHVIFYSEENLDWIKERFGFFEVIAEGRLISFSK